MDSRVYRDGKPVPVKTDKPYKPVLKRAGQTPHHKHPMDMDAESLAKEVIAWRNVALAYKYDPVNNSIVER